MYQFLMDVKYHCKEKKKMVQVPGTYLLNRRPIICNCPHTAKNTTEEICASSGFVSYMFSFFFLQNHLKSECS